MFLRLRPRLMMIFALVLPVSLVSLVLSAVFVYQSRKTTYKMNQNAFSFYMDHLAPRRMGKATISSSGCTVKPSSPI